MARKGLTWDGGFSAHFSLKSEAERAAPISRLTAKAEWSSAPAAWLGTRVHIQKMRKEKANGNFVKRCNLFFLPLGAETLPPKVQVRTWEPGEEGHCAAPDTGAPLALESATPASTGSAPAPREEPPARTRAEHSGPALCSLAGARALLPDPHPS